MQVFSFESMVQATDNFSPSNEIGQGGYGIVYKVIKNFQMLNPTVYFRQSIKEIAL